jgi:hypothetical protein
MQVLLMFLFYFDQLDLTKSGSMEASLVSSSSSSFF